MKINYYDYNSPPPLNWMHSALNKCRLKKRVMNYLYGIPITQRDQRKIPIHASSQSSSRDSFVGLERGSLFVVLRLTIRKRNYSVSRHETKEEKLFSVFLSFFLWVCLLDIEASERSFCCWVCQVLKRMKFTVNRNSLRFVENFFHSKLFQIENNRKPARFSSTN